MLRISGPSPDTPHDIDFQAYEISREVLVELAHEILRVLESSQ